MLKKVLLLWIMFCAYTLSAAEFSYDVSCSQQKITIVGCGYVGLIMAGVFSNCGHKVVCVDFNKEKITKLNNQQSPIYEPGLDDLLFKSVGSKNLSFVDNLDQSVDSDVFYICVGTPSDAMGKCDCSYINSAFNQIVAVCSNSDSSKIICVKSTVPPATVRKLHNQVIQEKMDNIHVVFNPEFMREGTAINDIYTKNPIVLGGESLDALERIENLYANLKNPAIKVIKTNFETAEIIKYAWNSFHAIRIAYVNELAVLCRLLDADITSLIRGLALTEEVLPTAALKPGPGYGGSCFPKDTSSFSKILEEQGFSSSIVHQAIISNNNHIERLINDIFTLLESSQDQTVTLLGLSFKANTDDIRDASSIAVIKALVAKGIKVKAYDPKAMPNMQEIFPQVQYCNSPYDAVSGTDCIVVLTEWEEIKNIDFSLLAPLCNKRILFDTRNLYKVEVLQKYGFKYLNMGVK